MKLRVGSQVIEVREGAGTLSVDGTALPLRLLSRRAAGESWELRLRLGDRHVRWWATPLPDGSWAVATPGGLVSRVEAGAAAASAAAGPHGPLKSPLAGSLTSLHVSAGQQVEAGAPLAVVEAMKMRYTISAEAAGRVGLVLVAEREVVSAGQVLLHLEPL